MSLESAAGCLWGLLVGNSVGDRCNYLSREDALRRFIFDKIGRFKKPRKITIECEIALELAKSIVTRKGLDINHIFRYYSAWYEKRYDYIENPIFAVFLNATDYESCVKNTLSKNSLVQSGECLLRCIPIAIYCSSAENIPLKDLKQICFAEIGFTHCDVLAKDIAFTFIVFLSELIKNRSCMRAYMMALECCLTTEVLSYLSQTKNDKCFPFEIGTDNISIEPDDGQYCDFIGISFVMAIWIAWNAESFEKGLQMAVEYGGNSMLNLSIVGAVMGAKFGRIGISFDIMKNTDVGEYTEIDIIAREMCKLSKNNFIWET